MKLRYLVIVLIICSLGSIFVGVISLHPADILHLSEEQLEVLLISRIPRLVSILIAVSSMSIAGLIMQQLSNNKFVSPTTAATLDSARFGVLVSLMFFTSATAIQKIAV